MNLWYQSLLSLVFCINNTSNHLPLIFIHWSWCQNTRGMCPTSQQPRPGLCRIQLIAVISWAFGGRLRVVGTLFCCGVSSRARVLRVGWCHWEMLISLLDGACSLLCIVFVCCPFCWQSRPVLAVHVCWRITGQQECLSVYIHALHTLGGAS